MWWMPIATATAADPVDVPLARWTSPEFPDGLDFGSTNGISAGDFDQDGWVDAFAWSGGALWQNLGGASWEVHDLNPITVQNPSPTFRYGASFADFDRDGFPEIATEPRSICTELLDNVDGTEWVQASALLGSPACGDAETIAWADVDGDGWIDLFVPIYPYGADGNVFYHSLGDDGTGAVTFVDETLTAGVASPAGTVRPEGVQFVDTDDDGDVDLYSNGVLYHNVTDSSVRFEALSPAETGIGLPGVLDEGAAFADYDLDGDLDLHVEYTDSNGVVVWRSTGDGAFEEAPEAIGDPGMILNLGLSIEDWDADGDLDLTTMSLFWRNQLVESGTARYTLATHDLPGNEISAATPAWVDFDRDGDLDAFLGNWQSTGHLYANTTYAADTDPADVRTVRVRALSDDPEHPAGLETEFGAVVEVVAHADATGRRYKRFVASGAGYLNQNEYALTFALPAADVAFDVSVDFPARPDQGQWRVDRVVNPTLGDLALADLADREIHVFRSGLVRIDGVDFLPDDRETPRLDLAGGGLATPASGHPLAPLDAAAKSTWVGLEITPSETTRLRELVVDGLPAEPIACGVDAANALLWDVTGAAPVRVASWVVPARVDNHRHTLPVDQLLAGERTYRVVFAVDQQRASELTRAVVGTVATSGGIAVLDADPCTGSAAAAAEPDPGLLWATVRSSASGAEVTVTTPPPEDSGTPPVVDSGSPEEPGDGKPADDGGCGCSSSGSGAPVVGALIALAALRRPHVTDRAEGPWIGRARTRRAAPSRP